MSALPSVPRKRIAIVACMDARVDPLPLLGLEPGDAHVIRNAGGVITGAEIRSLAISQHLLDTREIALIHHTDCGMLKVTDEQFAERMREHAGEEPPWRAHAFEDLDESVRRSMEALRSSPFLVETRSVRGYVLELETGTLREVEA